MQKNGDVRRNVAVFMDKESDPIFYRFRLSEHAKANTAGENYSHWATAINKNLLSTAPRSSIS